MIFFLARLSFHKLINSNCSNIYIDALKVQQFAALLSTGDPFTPNGNLKTRILKIEYLFELIWKYLVKNAKPLCTRGLFSYRYTNPQQSMKSNVTTHPYLVQKTDITSIQIKTILFFFELWLARILNIEIQRNYWISQPSATTITSIVRTCPFTASMHQHQ